ncbi:hypothetical protein ABZ307_24940 [Streptomyces griseorubiginosus]|uniref:hypothetical protein n=1 Tax=Streptomyces griseorubiginosus TaxID=67304 RepID=UPI0033A5E467
MKVFPLVLGPDGVPAITDPVAPVLGPHTVWAEYIEAGLDAGPVRSPHMREGRPANTGRPSSS